MTALHIAARDGKSDIVKFLLESPDIDINNDNICIF